MMVITDLDSAMLAALRDKAENSPRRRANHNIHQDYSDPIQRLFIHTCADSYFRPHRHSETNKWEFFWMVEGELSFLLFDAQGLLLERKELSATGDHRGVEIPPDTWHAVVPGDNPATFFEVKPGPYTVTVDKDFAPWAPAESTPEADAFVRQLKQLKVGQQAG